MQVKKQQRMRRGTTDWFQIGKGCFCHPAYLTYMHIMRNAGRDEAQAGIKIARRNIITSAMQMTPPLWQKVKRNSKAS